MFRIKWVCVYILVGAIISCANAPPPNQINKTDRQIVTAPTPITIPTEDSQARYGYSINGEYQGEYTVRFSKPFLFNNHEVFSATTQSEKAHSERIYRVKDYAYLAQMEDDSIQHRADPYQVTLSLTEEEHRYIWSDFKQASRHSIKQIIQPKHWHKISLNDLEYDAIDVETIFSNDQQQWLQTITWLPSLGIMHEMELHTSNRSELHHLIDFIDTRMR